MHGRFHDMLSSFGSKRTLSCQVLNCVGPYRFYGEAVVKACVENGAHHVDISGNFVNLFSC